jgi:hypothetical protein
MHGTDNCTQYYIVLLHTFNCILFLKKDLLPF